jgi:hypothetical protein
MAQRNEQNAAYVRSQYGKIPTKQIAANLKVSVHSVRQLAMRLGVNNVKTPRTESIKVKLAASNSPAQKPSKISTSENPAKFKILNPYDPTAPVRYEKRIDPNNGREMLVERRVQR